MKKIVIFLSNIIWFCQLLSQFQFSDTIIPPFGIKSTLCPSPSSQAWEQKYKRAENYIPTLAQQTKIVNINFNIFQKADGSGNFQNTDTDSR